MEDARLSRGRRRAREAGAGFRGRRRARPRAPRPARRVVGAHVPRRGTRGDLAARPRAHDRRGAGLHRPRAGRRALPPRLLPLQAELDLDRGLALSPRRSTSRRAPGCRPTGSARTSSAGVRAATGASATGRRRARTSSAPSSSPKVSSDRHAIGQRLLPGIADRRAHGPLGARALVRGAGQGDLRGGARPGERRQAPERDRGPQLPAREAGGRGRLPEGGLQGPPRRGRRHRRRARHLLARPGAPAHRQDRARRGAGAEGARACWTDAIDHVDEIGNAQLVLGRSLLEQDRLDEAGEAFADAESSFDQLSSASHRAAAWIAQGDLAARRGDDARAAALYRRAAEALQDFASESLLGKEVKLVKVKALLALTALLTSRSLVGFGHFDGH